MYNNNYKDILNSKKSKLMDLLEILNKSIDQKISSYKNEINILTQEKEKNKIDEKYKKQKNEELDNLKSELNNILLDINNIILNITK